MRKKLSSFDSRQIMARPDYEIQHKLDTSLKSVQLHHHDFYEMFFLVSGDVTYSIESKIYHVMPGDMLLISPMELHSALIRSDTAPYERYVLWLSPEQIAKLSTEHTDLMQCYSHKVNRGNLLHIPSSVSRTILDSFEMLLQESTLDSSVYGADMMAQTLIASLLVIVNRVCTELSYLAESSLEEEPESSKLISSVVDYLNLHYNEQITLDHLAEQFFVSKYHLSHLFSKQVGTSVYQYLQKKRLQIARQLLAQNVKPNVVYLKCGFTDYAGFYRAFRAEYGIAPRDYSMHLHEQQPFF